MNTKEKIELIEKNMGLVIFIAQKYFNAGIEAEIMILRNAIKKLSSRDQIIIKLLFGLENTEKKSQEEVASYFKVTQSIISRRKARSLRRLRTEMERYM